EELDRRREQSRIETEALSAKLRTESLERERLQIQREAAAQTARYYSAPRPVVQERYQQPTYFWSYGRRHHYPQRQIFYQQPGYFAGGQFWPTGSRTPSRPLIRIRRR
ncbi:MAG: hypothetical protein ABIV48_01610, partial [Pyrinomonadaceae bacterium]